MKDSSLDPLALDILMHLKAVRSDYVKSLVRNIGEPTEIIQEALDSLMEKGLVEKMPSGMLKRKHVKLKRKLTTHQHHTYYTLTREGDIFLRELD